MADRIIPPFGGFVVYPEEGGNIFERLLGGQRQAPSDEPSAMTPLVDVYEDDKAVVVTTDLPGVKKEDINVSVTDGALTINAEVKRQAREGGHWIKHERRIGTYVRNLHLSGAVDTGNISAQFTDGTLELTISKPKKSDSKTVQIDVA